MNYNVIITSFENRVLNRLVNFVDSGYSRAIIFSEDSPKYNNSILFQARKDQNVTLTIKSGSNVNDAKFMTLIDRILWENGTDRFRSFGFSSYDIEINNFLRFDGPVSGNTRLTMY